MPKKFIYLADAEVKDNIIELTLTAKIPESVIEFSLLEICENEHKNCGPCCPIFALNGNRLHDTKKNKKGCDCYKNPKLMKEFIRKC